MDVSAVYFSRLMMKIILFPDLIKMDIEGAEYEVLKDLEPYLKTQKVVIFLSTHGDDVRIACLSLLKNLNYKIIPLDKKNTKRIREYLIEPQLKG